MFKRKKKLRQSKVIINFKHNVTERIPDEIIDILPGQRFEHGYGSDKLWEGEKLLKQYSWRAGCSVIYEYFYIPENVTLECQNAIKHLQQENK